MKVSSFRYSGKYNLFSQFHLFILKTFVLR
uniref:Uncharacterized protein n=1 Tax=Arundo donax TaxID=35708 RepID=A0A0A9DW08_ARUDO